MCWFISGGVVDWPAATVQIFQTPADSSFLLLSSLFLKGQILTRRTHNALQLAPISWTSLNMLHTWYISIYKLLLCQFWDSPFNRTWIYANVWSHYAFDSQPLQTVSFNGSFAIELHIVGCLIGSFDIYIPSTVALTGQSSIRLPILPHRLFHSAHLKLLTEPRRHYGLDCHTKLVMWAFFLHEHIFRCTLTCAFIHTIDALTLWPDRKGVCSSHNGLCPGHRRQQGEAQGMPQHLCF